MKVPYMLHVPHVRHVRHVPYVWHVILSLGLEKIFNSHHKIFRLEVRKTILMKVSHVPHMKMLYFLLAYFFLLLFSAARARMKVFLFSHCCCFILLTYICSCLRLESDVYFFFLGFLNLRHRVLSWKIFTKIFSLGLVENLTLIPRFLARSSKTNS